MALRQDRQHLLRASALTLLGAVVIPAAAQSLRLPPQTAAGQEAQGVSVAAQPVPWWDVAHSTASDWVVEMARRFDGFFGDPRSFESEYDKNYLRLRVSSEKRRLDGWHHGAQLRLRLRLPAVSQRLRLLLDSDETEYWRQRDRPLFEPTLLDRRKSEFGLEYGLKRDEEGQWLMRLSGGPKASLRYRHDWALADGAWRFQARPQLYWHRDRGWGMLVGGDFLRPVGNRDLFRFSVQADEWGDRSGTHWRVGGDWNHHVSDQAAWSAFLWGGGVSSPHLVTEYRAGWRWRQSVWRTWFFYEVEPSVGWRRRLLADGQWEAARRFDPAIAVRFEVQFGKNP